MALFLAPHTVVVWRYAQAKGGRNVANNVTYKLGATLYVCINSKDASATFAEYGVEWTRPHKMLLDIADAGKVSHLDQIVWGSRRFRIDTPVRHSSHGFGTDHASVMLEELDQ